MNKDESRYTIVYFLDYAQGFGGAVNTLLQQAVLMRQEGYKVILFFSNYFGTEMREEYKEICLNFVYRWVPYQIASQPEDFDIVCIDKNYEKLRDEVASCKPDILHSVQINPCVELISRELKIPHIMNVYPLLPEFFSINYMDIFPHYHLCDSWYYAKKWQHYLKTDSTCIRTVVNAKARRKRAFSERVVRFVCVGSIYKGKNQLTVIKAFHKALKHGVRGTLTLCGYANGDYGKECIQYVEINDLQDYVIIKGFCTDMGKEYAQSDVLICGSTMESYPNAISEALANGLVVISTPVGGVPEIIEDGKNGYLTRGYSENSLCEKMIQVQKDINNGKIVEFLNEAERTFLENHSPQAIKSQLIQYYQYVRRDYKQRNMAGGKSGSIGVNEVRNAFASLMVRYYENESRFTEPDKIAQKLWYLFHIKDAIKDALIKGKEFYIWGTGKYGIVVKEIADIFLPEVPIRGFLDSNKKGTFFDYVIYSPEEKVKRKNIVIFVAVVNGQNEVIEKLEERQLVYNKDYFVLSARRW